MTKNTELDEVLILMHFALRAIIERPDRLLARHGLGRVHHRVLFFLRNKAPCSVGDLVEILRVSRQALNRPLRDLLKRKLIVSVPSKVDRRLRVLSLTAAGRRLEETLSGDQRDRFSMVFAQLGPRHERAWRDVMRSLAEQVWDGEAAAPPGRLARGVKRPGRPPRRR